MAGENFFNITPSGEPRQARGYPDFSSIFNITGGNNFTPEEEAKMREAAAPYGALGSGFNNVNTETTPSVPVVPTIPNQDLWLNELPSADESMRSKRFALGGGGGEVFAPSSVPVDLEGLTTAQVEDQITQLQAKRAQQNNFLDDVDSAQLQALLGKRDTLKALGSKGSFSNEMMATLLPQLFRQSYDKSEADRKYNQQMLEYQDVLAERKKEETRDLNDRQSAFSFMESLFPDIDLSGAGGELDPVMIPQLIQYAMSQASIKANRQNQVMAQPRIQFAV